MPRNLELRRAASAAETRDILLEFRAAGDEGTFEGYGSVFGVKDLYGDIVMPGAFTRSLAEHKAAGTLPAMLWQHDPEHPIGVWSEMVEDEKGLRVKGRLALDTVKGAEAYALLKMGALNGLSIGFQTRGAVDNRDGTRNVTDVDLWEVSLVTFQASRPARVTDVRGADAAAITSLRQAEKTLRDAGFSADAAKALIASVKRLAFEERDAREALANANAAAQRLIQSLKS